MQLRDESIEKEPTYVECMKQQAKESLTKLGSQI